MWLDEEKNKNYKKIEQKINPFMLYNFSQQLSGNVGNVSGNNFNGKKIIISIRNGGSAWESNPPTRLLTRYTGFEVREGHQSPFHFRIREEMIIIMNGSDNPFLKYSGQKNTLKAV